MTADELIELIADADVEARREMASLESAQRGGAMIAISAVTSLLIRKVKASSDSKRRERESRAVQTNRLSEVRREIGRRGGLATAAKLRDLQDQRQS